MLNETFYVIFKHCVIILNILTNWAEGVGISLSALVFGIWQPVCPSKELFWCKATEMFWLTILTMVTDKLTRMAKTLAKPKKESRANVCRLPHPGGFLSKSVWADSKIQNVRSILNIFRNVFTLLLLNNWSSHDGLKYGSKWNVKMRGRE